MKKRSEDTPENLGGLCDLLSADVLKKLTDLLQIIHQAEGNKQGSTVINIYAQGSQHIDNQINIGEACSGSKNHPGPPCVGREKLPEVLSTEEAMALWEKVQKAGYVDDNYQPLISRTQSALLADAMAERLGIREKWKVFEALWNRKYMYRDYYQALGQQKTLLFQDELKKVLT